MGRHIPSAERNEKKIPLYQPKFLHQAKLSFKKAGEIKAPPLVIKNGENLEQTYSTKNIKGYILG